jgi:hypothetical protein
MLPGVGSAWTPLFEPGGALRQLCPETQSDLRQQAKESPGFNVPVRQGERLSVAATTNFEA